MSIFDSKDLGVSSVLIGDKEIKSVQGVSIKDLYKVYKAACEEAVDFWKDNCFIEQYENDFKPLEVFLCVKDGDAFFTCDLPWISETGCSGEVFGSERVDLLACECRAVDLRQFDSYPYDEEGNVREDMDEDEVQAFKDWVAEASEDSAPTFIEFEEVVEEFLGGSLYV